MASHGPEVRGIGSAPWSGTARYGIPALPPSPPRPDRPAISNRSRIAARSTLPSARWKTYSATSTPSGPPSASLDSRRPVGKDDAQRGAADRDSDGRVSALQVYEAGAVRLAIILPDEKGQAQEALPAQGGRFLFQHAGPGSCTNERCPSGRSPAYRLPPSIASSGSHPPRYHSLTSRKSTCRCPLPVVPVVPSEYAEGLHRRD